jgi:hypothetical protein
MAEGDKDRPQVTQSSDSAEPSSISLLDTRSVSPLATGKGPLGLSESPKGPPKPSVGSGISRAPAPAPSILGNAAGSASEAAMRESIQRAARASDGHDFVRDHPVPRSNPKREN